MYEMMIQALKGTSHTPIYSLSQELELGKSLQDSEFKGMVEKYEREGAFDMGVVL
jgi:hypothetical protein